MVLIANTENENKRRIEIMSINVAENLDGTFDIKALDRAKKRWVHILNATSMELIGEE